MCKTLIWNKMWLFEPKYVVKMYISGKKKKYDVMEVFLLMPSSFQNNLQTLKWR